MHIVWMTWKDLTHPAAGGAEVVNEELMKRLVADGHQVTMLTASYPNAQPEETHKDGYSIIRRGNRYSVYHAARKYYQKQLAGKADLVIDEINTMPFFARLYINDTPVVLFVHMMCRQIWFYQMPQPFSAIGWLAEPVYMRILNKLPVITVSQSTKDDLSKVGYKPDNITIISEGISMKPISKLPPVKQKLAPPIVLSLGAMRPMKRTLDQVRAFELAKKELPDLQLYIAGDSSDKYGQSVLRAIEESPYKKDITYFGRVSEKDKLRLMHDASLILQTSIKEGWGLTVTEANSQGTPAAVYNIDGLRDSVKHNQTGVIAKQNNPQSLATEIVTLLTNRDHYVQLQQAAWEWSKQITFDRSYQQFKEATGA